MAIVKSHPNKFKQWLLLLIGTVFTVALLSWALRGVALELVWVALQHARWEWLLVGWLAYLASYWVRAWRWGTLLSATLNPGRFRNRLAAIFIGFGANSVLPAYAGEFIRAGVLYQLDGVPVEAAVGSIFVERLLDIGVVFIFLLLPIWLKALPIGSNLSSLPIGWLGSVIVLAWAMLIAGASFPDRIANISGAIAQVCGLGRFKFRVVSLVTGFLSGLKALRQPQRSLIALLETILIWGLNAITYWTGLIALGVMEPGLPGALFTQSMTALAIALPSTPGYVGPFEAGIRFSLNIYQVSPDVAVAYAILLRFLMYVTIPVIAVFVAFKLGFLNSWLNRYHRNKNV